MDNYRNKSSEFEIARQSGQKTERELQKLEEELKKLQDQAVYSVREINKIKKKSEDNDNLMRIYNSIISDYDVTIDDQTIDLTLDSKTYQITLSKLNAREQQLVLEIFSIIEKNLSIEKAEMLKKKIAERYN